MQITDNLHVFIWRSTAANNCNTYLIDGPTRVLIDPGHINHFEHVHKGLMELGLENKDIGLIICSHAHPDHVEAAALFKNTPTLITIHQDEWQLLKSFEHRYGNTPNSLEPDFFLNQGDLNVNGLGLKIFHTPGHSPGSVSIYWPAQKVLFTGDLIFKDGLGRTDLPGGDSLKLKKSIKVVSELKTEFLMPGHGDIITGAAEVKKNFSGVEQSWFAYI